MLQIIKAIIKNCLLQNSWPNGSDKTYQELNDMQDMFKDRNEVIEKSVKGHDLK